MFAPGERIGPTGSFNESVPRPTTDPTTGPTVSIQVSCEWLPYICGALKQLLLQSTWEYDTLDQLYEVQGRAFDLIDLFNNALCSQVPQRTGLRGIEVEEAMAIHVDCDCNVWVDCCDQLSQVQLMTANNGPRQPSQPPPAPAPGPSGCAQFYATVMSSNAYRLPVDVSPGDTITVTQLSGGWTDNNGDVWRCPTSGEYVLGLCGSTDGPVTGSDPAVTLPHMLLIAQDPAGNYYDARGTFVIASSCPPNASLVFMANKPLSSPGYGSASFTVSICKSITATGFYYGLTTNDWFEAGHQLAENIAWHPLVTGTVVNIASLTAADTIHTDNPRAHILITYATSFNPTSGLPVNDAGVAFNLVSLSVSGQTAVALGVLSAWNTATACVANSDLADQTTLPPTSAEYTYIELTSTTQFVAAVRIDPCVP